MTPIEALSLIIAPLEPGKFNLHVFILYFFLFSTTHIVFQNAAKQS